MARIAIACSSGAGSATAFDAVLIGQALARSGHDIFYLVDNREKMAVLASQFGGCDVLQAPVAVVRSPADEGGDEGTSSPSDLLWSDFADLANLRNAAFSLASLLRAIRPDCIIGLANPITWLVGPSVAPTLALGRGYAMPEANGSTPSLGAIGKVGVDSVLTTNASVVLAELSSERITSLRGLLDRCQQWSYGLDEFDAYAGSRRTPNLGVLTAVPDTFSAADRARLALFLDVDYPGIESCIVALAGLGAVQAEVFAPNISVAMKSFLSHLPNVVLQSSFSEALAHAARAAAIVHHGVPLLGELGLINGRPQLVLPWTGEQQVVLDQLRQQGVTWWKEPRRPVEELSGTLSAMAGRPNVTAAAEERARTLSSRSIDTALSALAAIVEATIAAKGRVSASTDPVDGRNKAVASAQPEPEAAAVAPPATERDTFCALPFEHLCIATEGTAKICCVSRDYVLQDNAPMTLYRHSVDEIWNSPYMRDVRRAMLDNQPLRECEVCYANEQAAGQSYRTNEGLAPRRGKAIDRQALRDAGERNGYRVDAKPSFIKLELGNLCNLKCRMCWGGNSSEIERDPVHSRWNGGDEPLHAVWQGASANIGPDGRLGVAQSGLLEREYVDGRPFKWTQGQAQFDVPLSHATEIVAIELEFAAVKAPHKDYRVTLNGVEIFAGRIDPLTPAARIALSRSFTGKTLTLGIQSDASQQAGGRGVPLAGVILHRRVQKESAIAVGAEVIDLKLSKPGLWYENDELVFDRLLGDASQLRKLFITGGEPLLEPRFYAVIDYLIAKGAAGSIDLEVITNATRIDEDLLSRLTAFRHLQIGLSIDGTEDVFEYMRFPARWASVARNIKRLRAALPNALISTIPVIQAYNVLNIADVFRFSTDNGLDFVANFLQIPPRLKIENLPTPILREAAARLRTFIASECPERLRGHASSIADYLATYEGERDPQMLHEFMVFTNDLDVTRNQSMRKALPELHAMLAASGFTWTDECAYSATHTTRRTARARVHAWV